MRTLLITLCLAALVASASPSPILAQPAPPPPNPDKAPSSPEPKKPDAPKPAIPPPPKPTSEITLKVGSPAPAIKADLWIKPAALADRPDIASFEPGKVYVVEFWATWCASCRDAMPGLAKLARAHKELTIIGVTSSERKPPKDAPDQRLDGVRRFIHERSEAFPYPVVFDGTRAMASSWIVAAGRVFIPCAFVIDSTGVISWMGDPREKAFDIAVSNALGAVARPPVQKQPVPEPPPRRTRSKKK